MSAKPIDFELGQWVGIAQLEDVQRTGSSQVEMLSISVISDGRDGLGNFRILVSVIH